MAKSKVKSSMVEGGEGKESLLWRIERIRTRTADAEVALRQADEAAAAARSMLRLRQRQAELIATAATEAELAEIEGLACRVTPSSPAPPPSCLAWLREGARAAGARAAGARAAGARNRAAMAAKKAKADEPQLRLIGKSGGASDAELYGDTDAVKPQAQGAALDAPAKPDRKAKARARAKKLREANKAKKAKADEPQLKLISKSGVIGRARVGRVFGNPREFAKGFKPPFEPVKPPAQRAAGKAEHAGPGDDVQEILAHEVGMQPERLAASTDNPKIHPNPYAKTPADWMPEVGELYWLRGWEGRELAVVGASQRSKEIVYHMQEVARLPDIAEAEGYHARRSSSTWLNRPPESMPLAGIECRLSGAPAMRLVFGPARVDVVVRAGKETSDGKAA
jgi:hypothetical protein